MPDICTEFQLIIPFINWSKHLLSIKGGEKNCRWKKNLSTKLVFDIFPYVASSKKKYLCDIGIVFILNLHRNWEYHVFLPKTLCCYFWNFCSMPRAVRVRYTSAMTPVLFSLSIVILIPAFSKALLAAFEICSFRPWINN